MSRLSWFPFYVDDFVGGTLHMTDAQIGRYVLCLVAQWASGEQAAIPAGEHELKALCRGNDPGTSVLAKFERLDDKEGPKYRNGRLYAEWVKAKREHSGKSRGGELTAKHSAKHPSEQPHNPQPTIHNVQVTTNRKQRKRTGEESTNSPESRSVVDDFNATTGRRIGYPGNVELAAKALESGVSPEAMHRVFVAVRDKATPAAKWWAEEHKGFDWLMRTTYKRHGDGQVMQGGLVKITNELDGGDQSKREAEMSERRGRIAHGRHVDPPATPEELAMWGPKGDA